MALHSGQQSFDLKAITHHGIDAIVLGFITLLFLRITPYLSLGRGGRVVDWRFFISPQREDGLSKGTPSDHLACRNIARFMEQRPVDMMVLWGSQSGTSELFARKFAQECEARLNIRVACSALDQFEYDALSEVPAGRVFAFVVATYGEGDPTDDAHGLAEYLDKAATLSHRPLQSLMYCCFGLGSRKYEHFNRFVSKVDSALSIAGAKRLGSVGQADGANPLDDTWACWRRECLPILASHFETPLEADEINEFIPTFRLEPCRSGLSSQHPERHVAEKCDVRKSEERSLARILTLEHSYILSNSLRPELASSVRPKQYMHLSFAADAQGLQYETGDHLAIWPVNPHDEVNLLAKLFHWQDKELECLLQIQQRPGKLTTNDKFASFITTRLNLLRYELDICGAVTREIGKALAHFCPSAEGHVRLERLVSDAVLWKETILDRYLSCGQLMHQIEPNTPWPGNLFDYLLDALPRLRPRYFSICSSPRVTPGLAEITASLEHTERDAPAPHFDGLISGYFSSLHHSRCSLSTSERTNVSKLELRAPGREYPLQGPRERLLAHKVFAQICTSNFRLPADHTRPIVMMAAGSGIAPFRAFVQERLEIARAHSDVGPTLLFYGCRHPDHDFLYKDWLLRAESAPFLSVLCAYSQPSDGSSKKYVSALVDEEGAELRRLLNTDAGGYLYVCGSSKMARGIDTALNRVLAPQASTWNGSETAVQSLQGQHRMFRDVWG